MANGLGERKGKDVTLNVMATSKAALRVRAQATVVVVGVGFCVGLLAASPAAGATIYANPGDNLTTRIGAMNPGDTLILNPGDYYSTVRITDKNGDPDHWFTMRGPDSGIARIVATGFYNMIEFKRSSYWRLENLELDGDNYTASEAFKVQTVSDYHNDYGHHIVLDGLHIHHFQDVCISTKATVWDMTVRNCYIHDTNSVGLYMGNSDGYLPIMNFVYENNFVEKTGRYNMEIKQQNPRIGVALGTTPGLEFETWGWLIKDSVFMRTYPPANAPRPNFLIDAAPMSGVGSDDLATICGNVVLGNAPTINGEHGFQLSGNIRVYNNVIMNIAADGYSGIRVGSHAGIDPRNVEIYNNTIFILGGAVNTRCLTVADVISGPGMNHLIANNALIRGNTGHTAFSGSYPPDTIVANNVIRGIGAGPGFVQTTASLEEIFVNPVETPGLTDLYPAPGSPLIDAGANAYAPTDDFSGVPRPQGGAVEVGAYEVLGSENPGWQIDLDFKGTGVDLPVLIASEPPADGLLPKTQNNVILLQFHLPITLPTGAALSIVPLGGGADVGDSFTYSVEPDGVTLKAVEQGAILADQTWYHLESVPGLLADPFDFELCVLVGDANGTGRVTTADYSQVKAHLGGYTDARYDLNGSGRVTTADYSVVKANLGNRAPSKDDATPPAAITNLWAQSGLNDGEIDLTWTAPGDDGATGTAASYDLRYADSPITESNWNLATAVLGLPLPQSAGSSEQCTVTGLTPAATYYFAIKASDEVPNESDLSNVPSAAAAGGTSDLTLQNGVNGYDGCADAHVYQEYPDTPHDEVDTLWISAFGGDPYYEIQRALVRFDLSDIAPGATITSAVLMLYTFQEHGPGGFYYVHELTGGWVESEVTWNSYASGQTWTTPGCDYSLTIVASAAKPTTTANIWIEWDLTSTVQAWISSSDSNRGVLIKGNNEYAGFANRFVPSEYVDDVSLRPKLVITGLSGG